MTWQHYACLGFSVSASFGLRTAFDFILGGQYDWRERAIGVGYVLIWLVTFGYGISPLFK